MSVAFDQFLDRWMEDLQGYSFDNFADEPEKIAVVSVDMTNAFCRIGNLASDRIAAIIPAIVDLFDLAFHIGIRQYVLLHDCHTAHAEEFDSFAEHGLCGTVEAEAVDEFKALPYYENMEIIEKNSINPAHGTQFDLWIKIHKEIETFIVVGDCTDLCVYQTAMHLRTTANAAGIHRRIIIPENCVQTYDLDLEKASLLSAEPHPGDYLHKLFLHHMHLNGIEVFGKIV